jgi:hypothetical protein
VHGALHRAADGAPSATEAAGGPVDPPQRLRIANFPAHYVSRRDDWEWVVVNQNVTFVSGAPGAPMPTEWEEFGFRSEVMKAFAMKQAAEAEANEAAAAAAADGVGVS